VNRIRTFKHKLLGNIKFFLSLNDGIDFPSDIKDFINRHILLLLFCDFIDSPLNEILIPDPYMSVESNRKILESVYNLQIPFFDRKPIAKFRGSQTGMPLQYNMDEVKLLRIARLKAVHLSLDFPDLLDVRFINSYDIQNNGGKEYTDYMNLTFGPPSEPESFEKFNNYRYLISFDGNFVAFSRPELIMSSGSVPLIQTRYKKYWSDFLEDGKNYIKIDDALSNLTETIKWLNSNPGEAERIALNARKISQDYINPQFMDDYFCNVLNEIQDLFSCIRI
jgi:hypothetical protein